MSNGKQHLVKKFLVMLVASLLMVGGVLADEGQLMINADLININVDQFQAIEIPPTIGNYKIQPGNPGLNLPDDFAPLPGACDNAAGSYLSEGMNAIRTTMISFDDIVFDNKDEELVYYALYAIEAMEFPMTDTLLDSPETLQPTSSFLDGDTTKIGSDSVCITQGPLTARLWQTQNGDWAVDTIKFNEPLDITSMWANVPPPANMQNSKAVPDYPVLVEGVVFRYMMPYIEPPITTIPGANNNQLTPSDDMLTVCDKTAPSYLNIGMDVMLSGYGYEKLPTNYGALWEDWDFDNTSFELSEYGVGVYIDILNETPLVGIPGNLDSGIQTADELYSGTIDMGTVVDGPVCTSMNAEPSFNSGKFVEASDADHDRFYTWWKIEVNGEVGWYPEVVGQYSHWIWYHHGIFNRKLVMYYMIPIGEQQANCPTPNLYAGLVIEPAVSPMNLRLAPNGDIIGRLDMRQSATLFGEPECNGGINWWQSDRGYLAETDPTTRGLLLMPYIPDPEPTPVATESIERPEPVNPTPVPEQSDDSSSDNSSDDNDKDKDRRPTSPTIKIESVTAQPTTSSNPPRQ